ncbi:MAG: tetratricopeptide repeat protein [Bacteroidia bacterium]
MKIYLSVLLFVFITGVSICQQKNIDSLFKELATAQEDTGKLKILNSLVENIFDDAVWPQYNDQMGTLSKQLMEGDNDDIKIIAKKYYAAYITNIGYMFDKHGNIPKAIEYYRQSLKIKEETGDKNGVADALNNIGNIYRGQGDTTRALDCYRKCLTIRIEINDSIGIANAYKSFGVIYRLQGNIPKSLENFEKSLKIHEQVGYKQGIADALLNVGGVYQLQGDLSKALECYQKSLDINIGISAKEGMVNSLNDIGNVFYEKNDLNNALKYGKQALDLSKKLGYPQPIRNSAELLKKIYKAQKQYAPALEMYELSITMRDSINNETTRKATIDQQLEFEFEKKEALMKAEQGKKDALAEEEIKKQKIIRNSMAGGAVIFSLSAFLIFQFYKRKRNAEMQHKIIDSRMRAINAQMNPHFIFNCMHSIQSLISKKDMANADSCLARFAKLIRKVLDNSTHKEITLEDDLETLNDYVELEKLRMEYPLSYKVNIAENVNPCEILIPPLLMQPLVENAIVHGLRPKEGPGEIIVDIKKPGKKLEITIADNGVGRKTDDEKNDKRKTYGVPLTKERLDYISAFNNIKSNYKSENFYNLENNISGTKVTLTIPLLN